jgi:HK97 family phage portal protein
VALNDIDSALLEMAFDSRLTTPDVNYNGGGLGGFIRAAIPGINVTGDTALGFAAWFSCLRVLSETMSILPWRAFEYSGDNDETRVRQREFETILTNPNPETDAASFWQAMFAWRASYGNAYAEIERTRGGDPVALWMIAPDRVTTERDSKGMLYYKVTQSKGAALPFYPRDMLHLRGPSQDGVNGLSVIELARQSLASGMQQDAMANAFWKNGTILGGVIERDKGAGKDLSQDALKLMLGQFGEKHSGTTNAFKTAYLDAGHTFKPFDIKLKDAEFIAAKRATALDVCRWFRMPPHKIGDLSEAHYNNVAAAEQAFVNDCITPCAVSAEQQITSKLMPLGVKAKINLSGLLRGDISARTSYYRERYAMGSINANEIRRLEDEEPIEGGDTYFVPANYVALNEDGLPITANAKTIGN